MTLVMDGCPSLDGSRFQAQTSGSLIRKTLNKDPALKVLVQGLLVKGQQYSVPVFLFCTPTWYLCRRPFAPGTLGLGMVSMQKSISLCQFTPLQRFEKNIACSTFNTTPKPKEIHVLSLCNIFISKPCTDLDQCTPVDVAAGVKPSHEFLIETKK